eukprot:gb/GECG01012351.1/.p1 GENE.gb/GECG01012351.1/~~gb/GECG01012351.1/.p1  ORF type:complete len:467 (+),score=35.82 gb/GECG01012351.1/:1-1401(+)
MVDIGTTLLASFQGVLRVLLVGVVGFLMEWLRKALDDQTRGSLSKIVYLALLPALLWYTLTESLNTDNLNELAVFPIFSLLYIIIGCGLGYLTSLVVTPRADDKIRREHVIACVGFSNHGYLPLVLAPAILQVNPFKKSGTPDHSLNEILQVDSDRSIGLISIFVAIPIFSVWSVCFCLIQRAAASTTSEGLHTVKESNSVDQLAETENTQSEYESQRLELSSLGDAAKRQGNEASQGWSISASPEYISERSATPEDIESNKVVGSQPYEMAMAKPVTSAKDVPFWKRALKQAMSPPILAILAGLLIGLIAPLKALFFSEDTSESLAPLEPTLSNGIKSLGDAVTPVTLLILGANIADQVRQRNYCVRKALLAGIGISKLIVMPVVCVGVVILAVHLELVQKDPIVVFVLQLESCTPTAMNLILMSELVNYGQAEISYVLFVMYMASIITMTCWIAIFLYITDIIV